jgi:multidrug efflux pump subunit AcrB
MADARLRWVPLGVEHKWFREQDDGLLTIYLRAPSNARLAETEKRVAAVEGLLEQSIPAKEREAILSEIGMPPDLSAAFTANAGPMDATVFVQLSGERTLSAAEYAARLRRGLNDDSQLTDLSFRFASRDMPAPVAVRLSGDKMKDTTELAREIRRRLSAVQGAVDVDVAQRMDAPYLVLRVNREKAAALGLSGHDVLKGVRESLPAAAGGYWESGEAEAQIDPRCLGPKFGIEDLLNVSLTAPKARKPIPLHNLATLQHTTAPVEIDHVSLHRVCDVRANVEGRGRRDVISDIRKMLQELSVPEGVRVELAE